MTFGLNYKYIIWNLIPNFLRTTALGEYLFSALKGLRDINNGITANDYDSSLTYAVGDLCQYNDVYYRCITAIVVPESFTVSKWLSLGSVRSFYNLTITTDNFLLYDGRTINLEKYLNETYTGYSYTSSAQRDPSDASTIIGNAIYVSNNSKTLFYVFNKIEGETFYCYNKWSSTTAYIVNDYITYQGKVYKCILGHTGKLPSNATYWQDLSETMTYMYNRNGGILNAGFVVNVPTYLQTGFETKITADINKYKTAGVTTSINWY